MGVGAVVSVVTFGLFHTKQISIFPHTDANSGLPDFWRVTILCLMAGAFSRKTISGCGRQGGQLFGGRPRDRAAKKEVRKGSTKSVTSKKTEGSDNAAPSAAADAATASPKVTRLPAAVNLGARQRLFPTGPAWAVCRLIGAIGCIE